jgi:hypothetical protein
MSFFSSSKIFSSKYQSTGSWETAGANRDKVAKSDIPSLQRG